MYGYLQRGHSGVGVEALLLQPAAVDDCHDVVDGDGRLRDVGGQHNLQRYGESHHHMSVLPMLVESRGQHDLLDVRSNQ